MDGPTDNVKLQNDLLACLLEFPPFGPWSCVRMFACCFARTTMMMRVLQEGTMKGHVMIVRRTVLSPDCHNNTRS